MPRRQTTSVALLALLSAAATTRPAVPTAIAVPPGHRLLLSLHATGVQVYAATAGKDGHLEWTLQAPLATLTDDAGAVVAYHYDGPTWEAVDGSLCARDPAEPVKSAAAPDAGRDVPWLLVKVRSQASTVASGLGRFAGTAYVQRVETTGGKAPRTPAVRLGTKVGVPYSATYKFYVQAG